MRPLTIGRLLFRCGILAALLFVVVVIALKMGAVQVSLYGLGRDLLSVLLGQSSAIFHRLRHDRRGHPPAAYPARNRRRSIPFGGGRKLSSALAQSACRSLCPGSLLRRRCRRDHCLIIESHLALSPEIAGLITPFGAFLGAAVTIAAVYFLGRPRWSDRQQHSSPRRHHHCLFSFRHHHVSHEHACRQQPSRHGFLADGRISPRRSPAASSTSYLLVFWPPPGPFTPPLRISISSSPEKKSHASRRGRSACAHCGVSCRIHSHRPCRIGQRCHRLRLASSCPTSCA